MRILLDGCYGAVDWGARGVLRCRKEHAVHWLTGADADMAVRYKGPPKALPCTDMCERCKAACR